MSFRNFLSAVLMSIHPQMYHSVPGCQHCTVYCTGSHQKYVNIHFNNDQTHHDMYQPTTTGKDLVEKSPEVGQILQIVLHRCRL